MDRDLFYSVPQGGRESRSWVCFWLMYPQTLGEPFIDVIDAEIYNSPRTAIT